MTDKILLWGLKPGLPFLDYRKDLTAVGSGTITKLVKESPKHAHLQHFTKSESTVPMAFGRAAHVLNLEGRDRFNELFKEVPKLHKGYLVKASQIDDLAHRQLISDAEAETWRGEKIKGADVYALLEEKFGANNLLDSETFETLKQLNAAFNTKRTVLAMLKHKTEVECSFFWKDKGTGVRCKGRVDMLISLPGVGICAIDYKTSGKSLRGFQKSIYDFGYYIQAAHYMNGLKACGVDVAQYIIIAQETTAPFEVVHGRLVTEALELGLAQCEDAYKKWAYCTENQDFPGHDDITRDFDIPNYGYNSY